MRAEQSLGANVTLQVENASMGMDLERVRKQWSEDMDTLHAEVQLWKEAAAEHETEVVRLRAEGDALQSLIESNERSLQEHSQRRESLEVLVVKLKEELVVATSTSLLREREITELRGRVEAAATSAAAAAAQSVAVSPAPTVLVSAAAGAASAAETTPTTRPTGGSSLTSAPTEDVLGAGGGSSPSLECVVINSAVKSKEEEHMDKADSSNSGKEGAKGVAEAIMSAITPPHRPNLTSYLYDSSGGSTQSDDRDQEHHEGEGGEERKMAFYQQRRVVHAHSSYMPKMLSHTAKMRADPGYLDEQESD